MPTLVRSPSLPSPRGTVYGSLLNKIAPFDEQLNVGDVVLAGSFTRPTPAVAGDNPHVDYGPPGSVAFRFV